MRIKLTSEQYDRLVLREQETRSKEPLNEGMRDVLLGVAELMEVKLSGLNKELAIKALSDGNIMREIKTTLEDEERFKEFTELLSEKGVKNPINLLANNAKKIIDGYNKSAKANNLKETLGIEAGRNLAPVDGKESENDSVVMN